MHGKKSLNGKCFKNPRKLQQQKPISFSTPVLSISKHWKCFMNIEHSGQQVYSEAARVTKLLKIMVIFMRVNIPIWFFFHSFSYISTPSQLYVNRIRGLIGKCEQKETSTQLNSTQIWIPIPLQPGIVNLLYFKLLTLLDQTVKVLTMEGLHQYKV